AAPPFFCARVVPVRVAAGSPNRGKRGFVPRSNRGHCPPRPWLTRATEERALLVLLGGDLAVSFRCHVSEPLVVQLAGHGDRGQRARPVFQHQQVRLTTARGFPVVVVLPVHPDHYVSVLFYRSGVPQVGQAWPVVVPALCLSVELAQRNNGNPPFHRQFLQSAGVGADLLSAVLDAPPAVHQPDVVDHQQPRLLPTAL